MRPTATTYCTSKRLLQGYCNFHLFHSDGDCSNISSNRYFGAILILCKIFRNLSSLDLCWPVRLHQHAPWQLVLSDLCLQEINSRPGEIEKTQHHVFCSVARESVWLARGFRPSGDDEKSNSGRKPTPDLNGIKKVFSKNLRRMKNDEDIQIIILLDSIGTKIRIKVTQMHRSDRTISERLSLGRGLPLFGKLESRTVSFEERRVSEVSLRRDDYLLVVEETSYVSCDRMYVNSV